MQSRIARFLVSRAQYDCSLRVALVRSLAISVFVGVFLVVFKPFDLGGWHVPHRDLWIALYALPCFAALAASEGARIGLNRILNFVGGWRVWHHMAFVALTILFVAAANHAYSCLLFAQKPCLAGFLQMLAYTAAVGVFPALTVMFLAGMFSFARNESAAAGINAEIGAPKAPSLPAPEEGGSVTLAGSTGERASFAAAEIAYLKAEGNYVEIVTAKAGVRHSTLLRATLHEAEAALAGRAHQVMRCHRSYLVNVAKVRHAEGGAQGLVLTMEVPGMEVPVSRSYVPAFRSLLRRA
jgi:hypothetical protein